MIPGTRRDERPRPGTSRPIRVVAVDDSTFFLGALRRALRKIPGVEVVGTASNGQQAISRIKQLRPDVLTLDLEMPQMDGIQTLRAIKDCRLDVRVIMVSAHTAVGAEKTLEALDLGAEDFITKPGTSVKGDKVEYLRNQLQDKILAHAPAPPPPPMSKVKPANRAPVLPLRPKTVQRTLARDIVVIGVSTGGPRALSEMVTGLPADFPGSILVVQHMPPLFTTTLAQRLDKLCAMPVSEAKDGEPVRKGRIYVAPGGYHMLVGGDKRHPIIQLNQEPRLHGCRPAADHLFFSAAKLFGARCQGVIMTGMGNDGCEGAKAVLRGGGGVIAQNEATCAVWGMPKVAWEAGVVEELVPLSQLAAHIVENSRIS